MSIDVERKREEWGTNIVAKCVCGKEISTFIEKGVPYYDGQGDLECSCGKIYSSNGQELRFNTREGFEAIGGESYAGERWEEE